MKEEIYETPKSNLKAGVDTPKSGYLYSPIQIGIGTYLGGPFAAMYFLKENFDTLGRPDFSKNVLIVGLICSAILIAILPFAPDQLPNNVVPIIYLVPVILTVKKYQLTKQEIESSESYGFQSSWKVFGMSLLWLMLFVIISIGVVFILDGAGIISLA